MAEKKSDTNARKDTAASEKHYKILHTIVLGKGETREERNEGSVTATEIGGERAVQQLLKLGAIVDPDAPMRPSEASEHRARSIVVDIARRGGIITSEGERYTFAGKVYSGADELQKVSVGVIADAIVAALASAANA